MFPFFYTFLQKNTFYMKFILIFLSFLSLNASTLTLSISSSPTRLNPILSNDTASTEIADWLFEGLFKYDKDGNVVVNIAKEYKFLSPTRLFIKLKDKVFWHDGVKVSAKDVVFTYEQIINPKVFNSIKSNYKEVKSVKALDELSLEIEYKRPYFKALEIWMIGLLPYHILKDEKDLMTSSFNKTPIGNGPYKIKEFKISSDIELFANENFFDGKAKIDKILYKFIPDSNTSFLHLKQNKLDLASLSPMQVSRQLASQFKENYNILTRPSSSYTFLGFNLRKEKFQDIRIRQALSLAINRQELIDILFFSYAKVCNGPFMPNTFAYNSEVLPIAQDIEKAKELLNQAGYNEENPLSFEIVTNTGNEIRMNAAQIIQHQLKQVGVNMKIRVMEWQAFLNTVVHPRNFEAILLAWAIPIMPDAYPLWHSSSSKLGGFNLVAYENKRVDELIEKALETIDKEDLGRIYKEISKIISDDLPYLFLFIPDSISAVNKKIKNIEPALTGIMHNQKDWEIQE